MQSPRQKIRAIRFEEDGYTFTLRGNTITITQPLPNGKLNKVGKFNWDGERMVDSNGQRVLLATTAQESAENYFLIETAMVPVDQVRSIVNALANEIARQHPEAAEAARAAAQVTAEKLAPKGPMVTKRDVLEYLVRQAKIYAPTGIESLEKNAHMHKYDGPPISQDALEAVVVDFINFAAYQQAVDLALYTRDLKS